MLRFGVGEFAGLVVKSGWPEFRSTFRATPTKACNRVPFQEVGAAQVRQNFVTSKAQVQAIIGGEAGPTQEVQTSAIPKKKPVGQPA